MLVSIIVNNFNYARFLRDAIESALNQSYSEIEVIVVDDGSTDDSRDIIREYGSRVKPVFKVNGGQGSAFNAGLRESSGDAVLFLDADDILERDAVLEVVKAWTADITKIQYPLALIDEAGAQLGGIHPKERLAEGNLLKSVLKYGSYATSPTSGNVFARDFLTRVMPIPEANWRDDADCYLIHLAPFFGKVRALRTPLARYRIHSSSLTGIASNGRLRVEKLRKRLRSDSRQQELLNEFCSKRGYPQNPEAVLESLQHYKTRLASLKMDPTAHPFQGDHLSQIAGKLIMRIWGSKESPVVKRLAFTVWTLLVMAAPVLLAKRLVIVAFSPHSRSQLRSAITKSRVSPKLAEA